MPLVGEFSVEGVLELPEQALLPRGPGSRGGADGVLTEDRHVTELDPQGAVVDQRLKLWERVLGKHGAERAPVVGILDHHHGGVDPPLGRRVVLLTPGQLCNPGFLFRLLRRTRRGLGGSGCRRHHIRGNLRGTVLRSAVLHVLAQHPQAEHERNGQHPRRNPPGKHRILAPGFRSSLHGHRSPPQSPRIMQGKRLRPVHR